MLEPVLPVVMQSMQDRPIREESEEILFYTVYVLAYRESTIDYLKLRIYLCKTIHSSVFI